MFVVKFITVILLLGTVFQCAPSEVGTDVQTDLSTVSDGNVGSIAGNPTQPQTPTPKSAVKINVFMKAKTEGTSTTTQTQTQTQTTTQTTQNSQTSQTTQTGQLPTGDPSELYCEYKTFPILNNFTTNQCWFPTNMFYVGVKAMFLINCGEGVMCEPGSGNLPIEMEAIYTGEKQSLYLNNTTQPFPAPLATPTIKRASAILLVATELGIEFPEESYIVDYLRGVEMRVCFTRYRKLANQHLQGIYCTLQNARIGNILLNPDGFFGFPLPGTLTPTNFTVSEIPEAVRVKYNPENLDLLYREMIESTLTQTSVVDLDVYAMTTFIILFDEEVVFKEDEEVNINIEFNVSKKLSFIDSLRIQNSPSDKIYNPYYDARILLDPITAKITTEIIVN